MQLGTANVVNLAWLKSIDDIGQCVAHVGNVSGCPAVPKVYRVRPVMQRVVTEDANRAPVRAIVFAWTIRVEQPYPDCRRAEHGRGVHDLKFVDPLGYRVVVQLPDFKTVHDVFGHNAGVVTIDFRGGEVDELELKSFLQPQDVLEADDVRDP